MKAPGHLRIGCGAAFSDDRIAPAVDLAEQGELDYMVFECLAERTVARENQTRSKQPDKGYSPRMLERMGAVLPACVKNNIRVISNMGAANPSSAGKVFKQHAREAGHGDIKVTVVEGDDVSELLRKQPQLPIMESGAPLESLLPRMVSGNAYLGADAIVRALESGAQFVLTGRVADPSLFVSAAMHHYGWRYDDWGRLAQATTLGHLLECGAQVTGGCFAEPSGRKFVPDMARLGFPYADIDNDGQVWVGKLDSAGGRVDYHTCAEQMLYEIHDPSTYITPDCILDITALQFTETAPNRVLAQGARARPRTDTYKVTVGYRDGYIGEGQITYAGIGAVAKAKWAAEIIQARLAERGFAYSEVRVDLIGMSSMHGAPELRAEPYEVRLRLAMRTEDKAAAEAVGFETRAMHVNGPGSGGGGSDPVVREVLAVQSVLLPRRLVDPQIRIGVIA